MDGYGGSYDLLHSKEQILKILTTLPKKLGMKIIGGPEVVYFPGNDAKDPGGWTGITLIAESHISIHTFPKRGFVTADVYTCKPGLDTASIESYFKQTFNLQEIEINFIKRGTRYPEKNIY